MRATILSIVALLALGALAAGADDGVVRDLKGGTHSYGDVLWTCLGAFLVCFMQAGFAMVEAGFIRAKSAVNILMKNVLDFSIGAVSFFLVGFGLMFGVSNGYFGTSLFGMSGVPAGNWEWTFLMFETAFAAAAATIVSGAMAERTKFGSYLIYSVVITMFIYPVFGSWVWGDAALGHGWLAHLSTPFHDFAGSTVVHSVGGWLAFAGAICLGPRLGKYGPTGKPKFIMGHNIPLATLGVFILWFCWFGFNAGSTNAINGSVATVALCTNLGGAAGALTSMCISMLLFKTADGSMTLNGALAGLVAITAGCDVVSPLAALVIGGVAGVLVVFAVIFVDRVLKVDDPVGAVSVHGFCGAWGTLAVGLFSVKNGLFYGGGFGQLVSQLIGAATAFAWAFGMGMILFTVIKKTVGLRASADEELRGLDIGEHGMESYSGFQIFSNL